MLMTRLISYLHVYLMGCEKGLHNESSNSLQDTDALSQSALSLDIMLWIPFVISPLILGAGIAAARGVSRPAWLLFVVVIAGIEIALIGKPSASWENKQVILLWALAVFLPWSVVAILIAFAPYPKQRMFASFCLPIVYFVLLVIGLATGDSFGLIPQ